jgi:hypothetical protein
MSGVFITVALMTAVVLAAVPAPGQDTPEPPPVVPEAAPQAPCPQPVAPVPDGETVYMPLQYLDENAVDDFARPLGVTVHMDPSCKNVLLYGPAKALATVKDFVTRLDTPPTPKRNVALTFYLVITGKEVQASAPKAGQTVLDEIAKLLDSTLGITQFSLWDTVLVRGRDGGEFQSSGFLPAVGDAAAGDTGPGSFRLKVDRVHVAGGPDNEVPKIALDGLSCGVEMSVVTGMGPNNRPSSISRMDTGLKADMNIRADRMEVVGKISISNRGDSAIVIASAHLLED